MIENPESPAAALGERSNLQLEIDSAVAAEVETFTTELIALAALAASGAAIGMLSTAAVWAIWDAAVERVGTRLEKGGHPPKLIGEVKTALSLTDVPGLAHDSAMMVTLAAAAKNLSPRELRLNLRQALQGGLPLLVKDLPQLNVQAQAANIARTAATAAFGEDMLNLLRSEGYPLKRWISRYDSRVRDSHLAVDGRTIPVEQDFIVGGSRLRYPGDKLGAQSETIGCRCVLIGVRP